MRVRDILTHSLDMVRDAELIPDYPPKPRDDRVPLRQGSVWSKQDVENVAFGGTDHPIYGEPDAVDRIARFIGDFKASEATRYPDRWPLPLCFGPFTGLGAADTQAHIQAGLERAGLKPMLSTPIGHGGTFELSEDLRVKDLTACYGIWRADRHGGYPWNEPLRLRLVVECTVVPKSVAAGARSGHGPQMFATLDLSAPALSLVRSLEKRLQHLLPAPPQACLTLVNDLATSWKMPPVSQI